MLIVSVDVPDSGCVNSILESKLLLIQLSHLYTLNKKLMFNDVVVIEVVVVITGVVVVTTRSVVVLDDVPILPLLCWVH